MAIQKERKTIPLKEKLYIIWDIDKCMVTCISLVKQAEKVIRLFFEGVNTLLILYKNFNSVLQIILTCIMILYIFSFWEIYVVKMFIHCLVIYLQYLLCIPING
jgi:hypothetical protein